MEKEQKKIRNDALCQWLQAHPFINLARVCRHINYNRGAFQKFAEGHQELSIHAIERLENALIDYGYKK